MQLPDNESVKLWYQEHFNQGFYSLLSFMGLDSSEVFAEGWIVRTADGREFIDCVGGYGTFNFGHRNPVIIEAVKAQLDRMPMSSKLLMNPVMAGLCRDLAEITPDGLTHSFISNSGTEAVECAIKLSRLATGKPGIISAVNAYHGKTLGSLSSTHRDHFQQPFEPLLGDFSKVPFGDAEALEAAVSDSTAAVLLEPVQGEAGIIPPPPGYLTAVREITRRRGVLLILDEVQTGFGRTGRNFACEHEGVEPDMLVLAKSLGGGVMPIGATVGTHDVWRRFEENPLVHTSTFGGNELACSAARAAVGLIRDGSLAAQAAATGAHFMAGVQALARDFPQLIRAVRGSGLMIGIDMASTDVSQLYIANVLEREVLIAFALNMPGVIRIEPPLTMPTDVVDTVLVRMREAAADTMGILRQYGMLGKEAS